jgi:hypothetical protein
MDKEKVTCSYCHKQYVGKVPKNSDGSILFPRRHYLSITSSERWGSRWRNSKDADWTCLGSYLPAEEF